MDKITAIYIRLSDKNKIKQESNSIINQRNLIRNYINHTPDLLNAVVKEYCDDGFTGVNFNRPKLQELLQDVELGLIECIIVKDFSRFGRNYVLVGRYLEEILPMYGVRFISIGNSYDSKNRDSYTVMTGFYNIAYAYYSKEVSAKVKEGKRNSALKGYYSGSVPPYGYKKSKENKHKLEIDEKAAKIVREIFEMRVQGVSSREIADYLNNKKIDSPKVYYNRNNQKNIIKTKWSAEHINRIIHNRCYLGIVENHKTYAPSLRTKKPTSKSDWISIPAMHSPLISQKIFDEANATYKKKANNSIT